LSKLPTDLTRTRVLLTRVFYLHEFFTYTSFTYASLLTRIWTTQKSLSIDFCNSAHFALIKVNSNSMEIQFGHFEKIQELRGELFGTHKFVSSLENPQGTPTYSNHAECHHWLKNQPAPQIKIELCSTRIQWVRVFADFLNMKFKVKQNTRLSGPGMDSGKQFFYMYLPTQHIYIYLWQTHSFG